MLKTNIEKLTKIVITAVSLLLIGCDLSPKPIVYDFELYGESLSIDDNGYYHFDLSDGIIFSNTTSRTKFVVNTNNPNIQKVGFIASHYWYVGDTLGYIVSRGLTDDLVYVSYDTSYVTWFNGFEVPIINGASYTKEALAYSWAAVPFSMIGDTVYIKASYFDEAEWLKYEETIGVIME